MKALSFSVDRVAEEEEEEISTVEMAFIKHVTVEIEYPDEDCNGEECKF